MPLINGYDLKSQFYKNGECILEKYIENVYCSTIQQIYPETIIRKSKLRNGQTDGIFRFKESGKLKFWMLQECKRDIGFDSVNTPRAFLQILFYLANFYYDSNELGVDKFKGIFLDSARFFCYIPKSGLDKAMEELEPMYQVYRRVRPSEAYIIPQLNDWAIKTFKNIKKYVYNLDENFRFDLLIEDLYNNKI